MLGPVNLGMSCTSGPALTMTMVEVQRAKRGVRFERGGLGQMQGASKGA
jgi:hypothetical protein